MPAIRLMLWVLFCALSGVAAAGSPSRVAPATMNDEDPPAATVVPSAPATAMMAPEEVWTVTSNADLRDVLYAWAQRAGWSLVWQSEYSYALQAGAAFRGDFIGAVKQLFVALGAVNPPLFPELYRGNRVLVIKNQPMR